MEFAFNEVDYGSKKCKNFLFWQNEMFSLKESKLEIKYW